LIIKPVTSREVVATQSPKL